MSYLNHTFTTGKSGKKKQNKGFFVCGKLISYISNDLVKFCCLNCKILKIQDKKSAPMLQIWPILLRALLKDETFLLDQNAG